MEEPSVQQVQDCVFDSTDVEINGKPLLRDGPGHYLPTVVRREVPRKVPRRVYKGIQGIGVARRGTTATRALDVEPRRGAGQRRSC